MVLDLSWEQEGQESQLRWVMPNPQAWCNLCLQSLMHSSLTCLITIHHLSETCHQKGEKIFIVYKVNPQVWCNLCMQSLTCSLLTCLLTIHHLSETHH